MKSSDRQFTTFIQETLSPAQHQRVQEHMDYLGFGSTANPAVYAAENSQYYITAIQDILGGTNQLPMHSHTFMEIFQYVSDSQVEYLIGTHRYRLQKGDFVCVPPGTCHQVLHFEPQDCPCVRNLLVVSPSILESMGWNSKPEEFFILRINGEQNTFLSDLFMVCIQETLEHPPRWQDTLIGYTHILIAQFMRNTERTIAAESDGLFEKILAYVDVNLHSRLSLLDTAGHFYVSERTVTREFQKNLGISFYRYVTQRRLLAARILISNHLPLNQVCQRTGFSDYPTFYRAFKKEFGISPRQLRNAELQDMHSASDKITPSDSK